MSAERIATFAPIREHSSTPRLVRPSARAEFRVVLGLCRVSGVTCAEEAKTIRPVPVSAIASRTLRVPPILT